MQKMKVLLITRSMLPGGTEREVLLLTRNINRSRFSLLVASLNAKDSIADQLRSDGTPVLDLNFSSFKRVFNIINIIRILVRLVKKHDVQVIHSYGYEPSIFAAIVKLLTGVKLISSQRNVYMLENSNFARILSIVFKRADYILTNSCETRRVIIENTGIDPNIVLVVYNQVQPPIHDPELCSQLRNDLGISDNSIVVGTVSNLRPIKNPHLFLEAAIEVCKRNERVVFISIGTGSAISELKKIVADYGLQRVIHFLGGVESAEPYYECMDVFTLTSRSESCSMAILEAMNHSLPIAATEVGGNAELVENGRNGFLSPSGEKDELVKNFELLISDSELRLRMSRRSKEIINQKFNLTKIIAELETVYDRMR